MKKSLNVSEWVISGSLILILLSLLLISHFHQHRKKLQISAIKESVESQIDIEISGEVSRPGVFSVVPGTRIGDLIKKSRPKRYADLSSIDLDSPALVACELIIPQLKELNVKIEGAVAVPIVLKMPIGSRISDLKSKIQSEQDADLGFFKRRRLLKNEEIITIPRAASSASPLGLEAK